MKEHVVFIIFALSAVSANAATIHVTADQPTIQAGLDAAGDDDTVLVAPGTYVEDIDFKGKRLVVTSSGGPDSTVIQAANVGNSVVSFVTGEPKGTEISGFTITGGGKSGIFCDSLPSSPAIPSPIIKENIITGNFGQANQGGGITLRYAAGAVIKGNLIWGNTAEYGAAIHLGNDGTSIQDDTVCYNVIYGNTGVGEIRALGLISGIVVHNNTISVTSFSGLLNQGNGALIARNNIIFFADPYAMQGNFVAEYNCTFNNANNYNFTPGVGNIYEDAMFVDTANHDYNLLHESPCINAGDPDPFYNDPDGTRNDMGALPLFYDLPLPTNINYGPNSGGHVVFTLEPEFFWSYYDTAATTQEMYELEVGTDKDWSIAEMWATGPVASSDTTIVYGGIPLSDDTQYYLRLRLSDGVKWGSWVGSDFIVNIPSAIHVPADQPTIQAAINVALDYDTVLVAPGTYVESINFEGKSIVLKSAAGPRETIITNAVTTDLVTFDHGENEDAVLEGFTIKEGRIGILCNNTGPTIKYNLLLNQQYGSWAAISLSATNSPAVIVNNTIVGAQNGGISSMSSSGQGPIIKNNIIVFCGNYGIHIADVSSPIQDLSYNDVYGNPTNYINISPGPGSFSADPLFEPDYSLSFESPCINAGDPDTQYNDPDGTRNDMGAFPYMAYPSVQGFNLGLEDSTHVINHTPTFYWTFFDTATVQVSFEIEVGTDFDWSVAEMWNPAPFTSSDTFVTYAGAALLDGETYYLRLRVNNGAVWSNWYETSFRMNTAPSAPTALHPTGSEYAGDLPILWVLNSTDAEGDPLTYDFSGFHDTDCVAPIIDPTGVPETPDSTGGQIVEPLGESCIYWWSAHAFDGYEYSDGSPTETFVVNATPEPPTPPEAQYPPDTGNMPVFDMLTYFWWSPSYDPDPLDTVLYKLEIAIDSGFNFVYTIDSIAATPFTLNDSLQFGTHYWWRVTAFDNTGLSTMSPNTPDFWTWTLGDLNHSHDVNIADLVFLVDYLFRGGFPPYPLFVGDVNGDCQVNVADLTYLVDYLFRGGSAPKVGCDLAPIKWTLNEGRSRLILGGVYDVAVSF